MLIAALPMQKMNIVELYCGCGGLSFVDRKSEDVHIETKWAVDIEPSMCAAFKANYPKAQVCSPPMIASLHLDPPSETPVKLCSLPYMPAQSERRALIL